MTGRERTVAAALAITFDDRAVKRHLLLRHPAAVDRAQVALDVADRCRRRRGRRLSGGSTATGAVDAPESGLP